MQLHIYGTAIRILVKGYLPISLITLLKLKEILNAVRNTVRKTNPDYDLVIKRLHLYYNMKLDTSDIDRNRNLIIQFPVFIQAYTQQPLILYQIETVPVLNHRPKHASTFLYTSTGRQTIHCIKLGNLHYNKTGRN